MEHKKKWKKKYKFHKHVVLIELAGNAFQTLYVMQKYERWKVKAKHI